MYCIHLDRETVGTQLHGPSLTSLRAAGGTALGPRLVKSGRGGFCHLQCTHAAVVRNWLLYRSLLRIQSAQIESILSISIIRMVSI